MDKFRISVIVPVYNSKKYLKRCLDSIVEQSYSDFQIVLVDDGSTDGSENICDEYGSNDDRITVVHQKNMGSIRARKVGLREAEGNFVYYIDSDDWIDQNLIENFMNIVTQYNVDMVGIGCKREYENNRSLLMPIPFENGCYDRERIQNEILPRLVITDDFFSRGLELTYWSYLIRKTILTKNLNSLDERIRIGEDVASIYPCWLDADSIYIKKNVYYHHRQRSGSMRSIESPEEYENLQVLYQVLINRFVIEDKKDVLLKSAKYLVWFCLLFSGLKNIDNINGIFPYEDFPKGSKVIIYGAGIFGNKVVKSLIQSNYAHIVSWVDENYSVFQYEEMIVESPEKINKLEFDYIILGVIRAEIRKSIKETLKIKYHVPREKIIDVDTNKINETPLPNEFQKILNEVH